MPLPLLYTTQAAVLLRPPKPLSDYGHTECERGAECWGKSLLVAFGLFSKVTRRKGGTHSSHHPNNGYVHPLKKPIPTKTLGLCTCVIFWRKLLASL
ncbi:hypothetical protein PflCFBP13514_23000 [Pseudomonas fluorescens]|nr:hypothetical protein PflCFBP13514_23000 [Pseudomonas fluorescens]